MNPLVASVIRTLIPVAVGQVASWLLLINVVLPQAAQTGLSTFLGGLLTAIYYVAIRVLEQQWPAFGVLLGLPSSPDTYSKSTQAAAEPATPTMNSAPLLSILAPLADTSTVSAADAAGFQSKIEAAIAGSATVAAPDPLQPVAVAP